MVTTFLSRFFFGTNARRRAQWPSTAGQFGSQSGLESRMLLAGNVTAQLVNGDLHLTGDSAANDIKVTKTSAGVIVQGKSGTTINGVATDFVAYATSVTTTGDIVASLGGGDDKIQIDNLTLDGNLTVVGGEGKDSLGLTQSTIHGSVIFVGAGGDDTFYAESSTIDGSVVADMGEGNDLVGFTSTRVKKNLDVTGGRGNDRVNLDGATIDNWLLASMGKGNDDIRLANGTTTNHVRLMTGGGEDLVQIDASHTTGSFFADLGRGNDSVSLVGAAQFDHSFILLGGPGRDSAALGTATLPAGQLLHSIKNRPVDAALLTARIDAPTTGLLAAIAAVRSAFITPVTAAVSGVGVLKTDTGFVSDKTTVNVKVTGVAGQQVKIDKGSGFVDPAITLDATGTATVPITLANITAANSGLNSIKVQQIVNGSAIGPIQTMAVQYTKTITVQMKTSKGDINIDLYADDAPKTTQNFLNYLARYQGSIIHRSAHSATSASNPNGRFIIQGGGFDLVPPLQTITADAAITNEFSALHKNTIGTIAMAEVGIDANSATDQWFINTVDNPSLDVKDPQGTNSGPYTVFGKVHDADLAVVNTIQDLTSFNIAAPLNNNSLTDVPLDGYVPFTGSVVGTVSVTINTKSVTGVGTQFTTALRKDQPIQIGSVSYVVDTVTSATSFTITTNAIATVTAGPAKINAAPTNSQYVQITSVTVIPTF